MGEFRIDPETHDYEMDVVGLMVTTNSLEQPAYIRLRAHFEGWLYDPSLGSELYKSNDKAAGRTQEEIVRRAEYALQPLIDDGRASSITVKPLEVTRYGLSLDIKIIDARTDEATGFPFFVPFG